MKKNPAQKHDKRSLVSTKSTSNYSDNLHLLAFDHSFQANIIFNARSGKIISVNTAACKLLGYSKPNLLIQNKANIFNTGEVGFVKMMKMGIRRSKSGVLVTCIKKNGKEFPCEINYALFTGHGGIEMVIATLTDRSESILKQRNIDTKKAKVVAFNISLAKSRQKGIDKIKNKKIAANIVLAKSKQKKIDTRNKKIVANDIVMARTKSDHEKLQLALISKSDYKKSFKLIFNSTSGVLFDSDLISNKVTISYAYEKEFGYKIMGNKGGKEDWTSHIHKDDLDAVLRDYRRMLLSTETEWKANYRFVKGDGSVVNVVSNRIVLRNGAGKAYRMIGSMHDVSQKKVVEERLKQEIKLKEKQIAEAAADAKEAERSDIGRELHDNVNQLLGVSKMYLDMAKSGGPNTELSLMRSSQYTVAAIEEIRKLTKGLTADTIKNLGLCEAIDDIIRDTMEVNPVKIKAELKEFKEQNINDKFKLNVFRILQEQLNNILKHAKATHIAISLLQNKQSIILSITDNGVGFDTRKKRKGIGIANIKSRVSAYNGSVEVVSKPGKGCALTVTFPFTDALLKTAA
jgi:two-component system sensor histidine kinase UhpB